MAASVVILIYDGVAADEAGLLVQILTEAGLEVVVATVGTDQVTSFNGRLRAEATAGDLAGCRALIVPGGMGVQHAAADALFLSAIADLAHDATWLAATSTGSVLLGAAGVIPGARATTHWLAGDLLASQGPILVRESFVEHGRLLTASGIVSAPRLAFRLVGALSGVRAEADAVARFEARPTAETDIRYGTLQARRWYRPFRDRRRISITEHPIDPDERADIVILNLDR